MHIGSINVDPGVALAPMAGVTDHPFRLLVKEQGCPLLFSEMISARGLLHGGKGYQTLLFFTDFEKPFGYQLFGSEPEIMARAASILEKRGADFIDLNFGCPAPKILKNGEGGFLMKKPRQCKLIVEAVVNAVSCPVTVKMRKGWNDSTANAPALASIVLEAGAAAVTVHGRTVEQGYSGKADWDTIKEVAYNHQGAAIIGNGDVDSPQRAVQMLDYCKCSGVMIGRAALGNPWIFSQVIALLKGKKDIYFPTLDERKEMAVRHLNALCRFKGERAAVREMRKHICWYIKGYPGAAEARKQFIRAETRTELIKLIYQFSQNPRQTE